jgi:pyruvate/2-oxoglutarate dehydrogenase complex dihydrolipoamide dehydrogenase (E3) component
MDTPEQVDLVVVGGGKGGKTLVQSAKVAAMVRRAGDYGIGAELTGIDMNAVREHKRAVVSFMRGGNYKMFTNTPGLAFMLGAARMRERRLLWQRGKPSPPPPPF